jgi:ComF family protein
VKGLVVLIRQFFQLVWPLNCAGCGAPDYHVCPQCLDLLDYQAQNVAVTVDSKVPIYAIHRYDSAVRNLVLGFKNADRADLEDFFQKLIQLDVKTWLQDFPELNQTSQKLVIVPAPSTTKSQIARSTNPTRTLAIGVERALSQVPNPPETQIVNLLLQKKGTKQENLTYRERSRNKVGTIQMNKVKKKQLLQANYRKVILVDDVLTTGSTVRECVQITEENGFNVVAVMVIAKS